MLGCKQEHPKEKILVYSSETEKLLNETFLDIVGTDLYYKIEDKYLNEAINVSNVNGEEAGRKVYDNYKEEDPSRLVIFTKDKFVSNIYINNRFADTLMPDILSLINERLFQNKFIETKGNTSDILDSLSLPLKISRIYLRQTGRFELVKEGDIEKLEGRYKTYGTFSCSRIYIDNSKGQACFFYEKNCFEGFKCAAGKLVLLKKKANKWEVFKELTIYQT